MISRSYFIKRRRSFLLKLKAKGFSCYTTLEDCINIGRSLPLLSKKKTLTCNLKKKTTYFRHTGSFTIASNVNWIVILKKKISKKFKYTVKKNLYFKYIFLKVSEVIPNIPSNFMYKNRPPSVVYLFFKKRYVSGVAVIYNTTTHFENTALGSVITFRGMGKGFPVYKNNSYSFIRYLVDFFISESLKHGFTEVSLPVLVKAGQVFRTGQLPDKEGQMFMVGKDNLYLLPTAEVSVTNLLNNKKLHLSDLPILYSSYSLCFRREIGGWGRLNKGLNRVHQFDKVELVKVVDYLNSNEGLILLSNNVIALLDKLNITYRVISIWGPDLSFSGSKQLDIEVWSYGQGKWLEVSSCSNMTTFQARRLKLYFSNKKRKHYPHTLNGSGLAVQRVLVSLLENSLLGCYKEVKIPCIMKYKYVYKNIGL